MINNTTILKRFRHGTMRVRTRVTPAGWGFFGLILCGFLLSVNFSNNLIFAMTFMLVSIALVGWYHTRMNVAGLEPSDWRCTPVFAGQKAVYRIQVDNPSSRHRHIIEAVSLKGSEGVERHFFPKEQGELSLKRSAPSRGVMAPAQVFLQSSFPLGIFQSRMAAGDLPECLVFPAPQGEQPLPESSSGSQAHLSSESGSYKDMRRYSPGDPMSRIHWKAMARFDELYTKEFDGAQGLPALWLRWRDVQAKGVEPKLSQLCRWVLDAHRKKREYGLELPGLSIAPAGEEPHLKRCLEALALYANTEKSK